MTTTAQATAAPIPLRLGNKTYRLSPLRDRDYGAIERWLQDRHIALVRRNLDGLPAEARDRQLDRAFAEAREISARSLVSGDDPYHREATEAFESIEGLVFMTWLMLQREHPELSEDDVSELMLASPERMQAVMDQIAQLAERGAEAKKASKKKVRRKPPKRR